VLLVLVLLLWLLLVVVLVLHVRLAWLVNGHIKLVSCDHASVGWGNTARYCVLRDLVELRGEGSWIARHGWRR